MPQITLDLPDADFEALKKSAEKKGLRKYFQDALGLAQLFDKETQENDHLIQITDKAGKVIENVEIP